MSNIKITELAAEINKTLEKYTDEVEEALEKTEKSLADEAVKTLKRTSPKKEGEYAKGWKKKKVGKKMIVFNKVYQLTHLLEKGHRKRGGGRVRALVHIAPVEEMIQREAANEFERFMK